jgi:hypothetical protein
LPRTKRVLLTVTSALFTVAGVLIAVLEHGDDRLAKDNAAVIGP